MSSDSIDQTIAGIIADLKNKGEYYVKKLFLFGFAILIVSGSAGAETIRGTHWGMTVDQVKTVEKWDYEGTSGDRLLYRGELTPGKKTELFYTFHDGHLIKIRYKLVGGKDTYNFFSSMLWNKYKKAYEERTQYDVNRDQIKFLSAGRIDAWKFADFLYMRWKIHGEKNEKTESIRNHKTHLEIFYLGKGVNISYESMVYRKARKQLEKDQSRDAIYSLENTDDL